MAESQRVEIRKLGAEDAQSFWQLRMEGLELEPQAFMRPWDSKPMALMFTPSSSATATWMRR